MPCIICGKPVEMAGNPAMVRVFWGTHIVTDAEARGIISREGEGGDVGGYPIGAGCLRKHPEIRPYTRAEPEETTMAAKRKSQAEIADLKAQWRADPCWDIEETEGFEAHKEELVAYRLWVEVEARLARQEQLATKAREIGCDGNLDLAEYVLRLEQQVAKLVKRVDELAAR
jgi:hypothetical protein